MRSRTRRLALLAAAGLWGCALAGTPTSPPESRYEPAENVLEVIAVLRRHVPDDTYRFEPARDFTGRNVYRSSLLRLESLEQMHADALRAGHLHGAIAFAKARALERLRAYDLAADQYRFAAEREQVLRVEALRSADLCDALERAVAIASAPEAPLRPGAPVLLREAEGGPALAAFDERLALLANLERTAAATHHVAVVREEIERADAARARYFVQRRHVEADGDVRAVAALQAVALRHRDSKNANRHVLALAGVYAALAEEYVAAHAPESLDFDPVRFQELVDAAARLYEIVANQDGTTEKLEASRNLEAFLAFALRVDRDRFTP